MPARQRLLCYVRPCSYVYGKMHTFPLRFNDLDNTWVNLRSLALDTATALTQDKP